MSTEAPWIAVSVDWMDSAMLDDAIKIPLDACGTQSRANLNRREHNDEEKLYS